MLYRALGRTGVRVSSLCLGTMAFGGDADDATAQQMVAAARDRGINLFDCANVYNQGRAEEILGKAIAGCRDDVVITTKAYFPTGDGVNARGSSRYHLVAAVEASLRRLDTDRIDVFFLHRFDDDTPLEETLRAVEDLVGQGKILYVGASNFAAWQVAKAVGIADRRGWSPIACVQPMYNLVKRQAEVEILPMCRAEKLGVMTYSPLGGGLLSGKYGVVRRPDKGRIVDNLMYQTRYGDTGYFEVAERFATLAKSHGVDPVTLAVAWVASHPAVTAPIIGGRNVAQLTPALAAAEFVLSDDLRQTISGLWPSPPPATDRNEERSEHNYGARLGRER